MPFLDFKRDKNDYCNISDYAFLSDCRSSALVAKDGSIDWLCFPRFDSPSVFAKILDANNGGYFSIKPTSEFKISRKYIDNSHILETTFTTNTGKVKLIDWLHQGSRQSLCRMLVGISGEVELDIICDLRANYAQESSAIWSERMGYLVCDLDKPNKLILDGFDLKSESLIELSGENKLIRPRNIIKIKAKEERYFSLSYNKPGPSHLNDSKTRTLKFWNDWSSDLDLPIFKQKEVLRSALVLKGLQYAPSGAIIAAATTSLPESIGSDRNWDYRYSWLRDASFTLEAFGNLNKFHEAQSWFDWLSALALQSGKAHLNIMYGIEGESELTEKTLDNFSGYKNSKPIRIGNGAYSQKQIDTYGELLDAFYFHQKATKYHIHPHKALFIKTLANQACQEWNLPDEGIWEVRGQKHHFVYSKVMCWVALDRAIKLAKTNLNLFNNKEVEYWEKQKEVIKKDILDKGYNKKIKSFTISYDSKSVDASLLTLAKVGFIKANDPKFINTVNLIANKLSDKNGLIYRYDKDFDDNFNSIEGSFTICSLWLVMAYIQINEINKAKKLFNFILSNANDLGLFAEQLDAKEGHLGNFPQAFTHIAIINCAILLEKTLN